MVVVASSTQLKKQKISPPSTGKQRGCQPTVLDASGKLDFAEYELQLFDTRYMNKGDYHSEPRERFSGWLKPSCIPITIILVLIVLVVLLPLLEPKDPLAGDGQVINDYHKLWKNCSSPCIFALTESIPDNLTYGAGAPTHISTFESWMQLINSAESSIDIVAFYWSLKGSDVIPDPSDWQGEAIFQALLTAGTTRGIKIRIAQNKPTITYPNNNSQELERKGAAEVRNLDFDRLLEAGVLHTKMWLVDEQHFYVGSANMDWRALTQVKELGATVYNCTCMAKDMSKIFEVYWMLGKPNAVIPPSWPANLSTLISKENPVTLEMNGTSTKTYLSSSPPPFCPLGRTNDLDSILDVMSKASKFIDIAVMEYFPNLIYSRNKTYWPVIDDTLRRLAVEHRVHIRLLAGYWNNTRPIMLNYLNSLQALNNSYFQVEVKLFVVPAFTPAQAKIPYARVAHNKYMVTDKAVYIGTSNWSGDYFINTGGIGFILDQSHNEDIVNGTQPIREQVQAIFDRDWSSKYAHTLDQIFESQKY